MRLLVSCLLFSQYVLRVTHTTKLEQADDANIGA